MKKLNSFGVSHFLIPVVAFLLVGVIGGAYLLKQSHAATPVATTTTTTTTTTTAASTSAIGGICTTSGSHLCLYAPNFNYGTIIVSSPSGSSRTVCAPMAGSTSVIRFCGSNAPSDRCVDAYSANTYDLRISHCSGVSGVDWYNNDNGDGSRSLKNVHYSRWMAGDNRSGDAWIALPLGQPGWDYKMRPIL